MNVVLNTMIIAVHAVKDLIGVMNMNRKECLKAYENLCSALIKTDYVECHKCYSYQTHEEELGVFYKLIEEHFDNPPLKFEELEESKDYYHFEYGWIRILNINDRDCIVIVSLGCPGYFSMEFEECMFYRKQVEE